MKSQFAFVILVVALLLSNLSCGQMGKGANAPFSEDDRHRSFQAAAMSGDAGLIREVSRRLCLSIPDGASQKEIEKFLEEHKSWVVRNDFFIANLKTAEGAKQYLALHMPPTKTDCWRQSGSSGAGRDACSLVSWDEVTEATGMPVGYTSSITYAEGESECSYHPTKGSLRGVMILVKWRDGSAEMSNVREEFQADSQDSKALKRIVGIGDEAYAAGDDFYMRRNQIFITIRLVGIVGNTNEKAKILARKIVERL
jgi:hypothetical protein